MIGGKVLSLNRLFNALLNFGLSKTEAKIYIYLANDGPSRARDIIDALTMNKQQVYRTLKKLRNRRIVNSTGFPATFYAESVEAVLKNLMKEKHEQAQLIEETKTGLLSLWDSFSLKK